MRVINYNCNYLSFVITYVIDYFLIDCYTTPCTLLSAIVWGVRILTRIMTVDSGEYSCTTHFDAFVVTHLCVCVCVCAHSRVDAGASVAACSDTYRGSSAGSELETQALQNAALTLGSTLVTSIHFHTYGPYWLIPWGSYAANGRDCSYAADDAEMVCSILSHTHSLARNKPKADKSMFLLWLLQLTSCLLHGSDAWWNIATPCGDLWWMWTNQISL